jgi:hypothetical protein
MSDSSKRPIANVYAVVPTGGDNDKLVRVGAAWLTQNGSLSVVLEAVPTADIRGEPRYIITPRDDAKFGLSGATNKSRHHDS